MSIRENYSHAKADARKAQKRKEAEGRQASRDLLSNWGQVAQLDHRNATATKERLRILA